MWRCESGKDYGILRTIRLLEYDRAKQLLRYKARITVTSHRCHSTHHLRSNSRYMQHGLAAYARTVFVVFRGEPYIVNIDTVRCLKFCVDTKFTALNFYNIELYPANLDQQHIN